VLGLAGAAASVRDRGAVPGACEAVAAPRAAGRARESGTPARPHAKRTCCRAGWCVTSIAGAVDQGSRDSGFELGGVPLHTRG
jgi:hypothetical protein